MGLLTGQSFARLREPEPEAPAGDRVDLSEPGYWGSRPGFDAGDLIDAPLRALGAGFDVLDTPGRGVRTLLGTGDVGQAWDALWDPSKGTSVEDLRRQYLGEDLDQGEGFDLGDVADFGRNALVGGLTDPLSYLSFGTTAAGKTALRAGTAFHGAIDASKALAPEARVAAQAAARNAFFKATGEHLAEDFIPKPGWTGVADSFGERLAKGQTGLTVGIPFTGIHADATPVTSGAGQVVSRVLRPVIDPLEALGESQAGRYVKDKVGTWAEMLTNPTARDALGFTERKALLAAANEAKAVTQENLLPMAQRFEKAGLPAEKWQLSADLYETLDPRKSEHALGEGVSYESLRGTEHSARLKEQYDSTMKSVLELEPQQRAAVYEGVNDIARMRERLRAVAEKHGVPNHVLGEDILSKPAEIEKNLGKLREQRDAVQAEVAAEEKRAADAAAKATAAKQAEEAKWQAKVDAANADAAAAREEVTAARARGKAEGAALPFRGGKIALSREAEQELGAQAPETIAKYALENEAKQGPEAVKFWADDVTRRAKEISAATSAKDVVKALTDADGQIVGETQLKRVAKALGIDRTDLPVSGGGHGKGTYPAAQTLWNRLLYRFPDGGEELEGIREYYKRDLANYGAKGAREAGEALPSGGAIPSTADDLRSAKGVGEIPAAIQSKPELLKRADDLVEMDPLDSRKLLQEAGLSKEEAVAYDKALRRMKREGADFGDAYERASRDGNPVPMSDVQPTQAGLARENAVAQGSERAAEGPVSGKGIQEGPGANPGEPVAGRDVPAQVDGGGKEGHAQGVSSSARVSLAEIDRQIEAQTVELGKAKRLAQEVPSWMPFRVDKDLDLESRGLKAQKGSASAPLKTRKTVYQPDEKVIDGLDLAGVPLTRAEAEAKIKLQGTRATAGETPAKGLSVWDTMKAYYTKGGLEAVRKQAANETEFFLSNPIEALATHIGTSWTRAIRDEEFRQGIQATFRALDAGQWERMTALARQWRQGSAEAGDAFLNEMKLFEKNHGFQVGDLLGAKGASVNDVRSMLADGAGPTGWAKLSDVEFGKDVYLPKPIADRIRRWNESSKGLGLANTVRELAAPLSQYMSVWKGANTWWWPTYHVRNLVGDTFRMLQEGTWDNQTGSDIAKLHAPALLPSTTAKGYVDYGAWKDTFFDVLGGKITGEELLKLAEKEGVIDSGQMMQLAMDGAESVAQRAAKAAKLHEKLGPNTQRTIEWYKNALGWRENATRAAAFASRLRAGDSATEAALRTEEALFNFSRISPAAKFLRDTGIAPFIAYQAKNIPAQIEWAMSNPGGMMAVLRGLQEVSQGNLPEHLLPEYMQNKYNIKLTESEGRDPKTGKTTTNWTVVTPNGTIGLLDLGDLAQHPIDQVKQLLGPIPKALIGVLDDKEGNELSGLEQLGGKPVSVLKGVARSVFQPIDPKTGYARDGAGQVIADKLLMPLSKYELKDVEGRAEKSEKTGAQRVKQAQGHLKKLAGELAQAQEAAELMEPGYIPMLQAQVEQAQRAVKRAQEKTAEESAANERVLRRVRAMNLAP